jgi:predicted NBD/HSP70 family sugar kinase
VKDRGSTLDGLRRRNLSIVLDQVHRTGPLSRAAITAATGLNRSTVAALVSELEDQGLLVEGNPLATARVGRPSPLVSVAHAPAAIAINPEVDAITIGVVGLGARVDEIIRHEVDHVVGPEEAVAIIGELVDGLAERLRGRRVVGAGLAIPGIVRAADDVVRWAPHLGWRETPISAMLAARLGIPCRAANDATLGAQAEQRFGSGRGISNLVYLHGGASGIGGGVIVRGEVVTGRDGYAGEYGQNRPGAADDDRRTAGGALEDEVSRDRLLAVLHLPIGTDELELAAALLASRDRAVLEEIARQQRILGVAIANAVNVLNPSLIVLGGFLSSLELADPEGLAAEAERAAIAAAWEGTRIVPAELGAAHLLIGAAELAFAPLVNDPGGFRLA